VTFDPKFNASPAVVIPRDETGAIALGAGDPATHDAYRVAAPTAAPGTSDADIQTLLAGGETLQAELIDIVNRRVAAGMSSLGALTVLLTLYVGAARGVGFDKPAVLDMVRDVLEAVR